MIWFFGLLIVMFLMLGVSLIANGIRDYFYRPKEEE